MIWYAESPQSDYDYDIQKQLHWDTKSKQSSNKIEIETLRSMYKISDRCTPESIVLKENLISCNKPEMFRTYLIQYYIEADWQKFAQKYAFIDFILNCIFLVLIMAQFWQIEQREVYTEQRP